MKITSHSREEYNYNLVVYALASLNSKRRKLARVAGAEIYGAQLTSAKQIAFTKEALTGTHKTVDPNLESADDWRGTEVCEKELNWLPTFAIFYDLNCFDIKDSDMINNGVSILKHETQIELSITAEAISNYFETGEHCLHTLLMWTPDSWISERLFLKTANKSCAYQHVNCYWFWEQHITGVILGLGDEGRAAPWRHRTRAHYVRL